MRQTLEGLLGTSIACPTIGDRLLRAYIAFFEDSLDEDETRRLLELLPRQAGVTVRDILVTALAETLCRWSEHPRIVIDLEGHGREEIGSEKVNLSRTIGWFTSFYPALLELPASDDLRDSLNEIARRLRRGAVPRAWIRRHSLPAFR